MSSKLMPELVKLESSPVWKEANRIAEYMYKITANIPEEDRWQSPHKMRLAANDMIFNVALGLGNGAPSGQEFDWGYARKYVAGLKTMYRFWCRQGSVAIDPEIMVALDRLTDMIDAELKTAYERAEKLEQENLKPWLKKYKMWQEMAEGPKL